MTNLKMILTDGTELPLEGFGVPCHAVMTCASKEELSERWAHLTPENLERVEIQQDDEAVFKYAGCVVSGVQAVMNGDDSLTVHFYLDGVREITVSDTDREYIQAAKILLGEEE